MKYLLLITLAALTASAAEIRTMKGCGVTIPTVDPWDSPPRCLFVHVKSESADAASVMVTFTYLDAAGDHQFQFQSVNAGRDTAMFWAPESTMLKVEVEERDVDGRELMWQQVMLLNCCPGM